MDEFFSLHVFHAVTPLWGHVAVQQVLFTWGHSGNILSLVAADLSAILILIYYTAAFCLCSCFMVKHLKVWSQQTTAGFLNANSVVSCFRDKLDLRVLHMLFKKKKSFSVFQSVCFGPIKVHTWRKTWGAAVERPMSLLLKNEANTETTKGAVSLMSTWGSSSESYVSMSSITAEIKRFTACCKNQLQPLWIVSMSLLNASHSDWRPKLHGVEDPEAR